MPATVAATLPPTTAPVTTDPATTLPATNPPATNPPATDPPATEPPTTVVVETTVPAETAPPVVAVTDDPCLLAAQLEIAVTFGGDVQDARPSTDPTGVQRSCEWRLDADESSRATITVTRGRVTDASTGWPASPVAVDGLGEESFSFLDNDLHLGFVRSGLTVTIVVTDTPASTVPDWVALAKVMDRRITGEESLPV